ncbi:MAG: hypothetical protein LBK55_10050, partial [Azoarcus sp.]|nr:hypothetical protein [Azoarcus sp.]
MASIRRRGDLWEASVCVGDVRRSASHPTKRAARAWAAAKTVELEAVKVGGCPDVPVSVVFERYARECSVTKRGCRWEVIRLNRFIQYVDLSSIRLPMLRSAHLAAWRDRRLSEVSPASVLREMNLISHVFTVAVREWNMLAENPLKNVRDSLHNRSFRYVMIWKRREMRADIGNWGARGRISGRFPFH